VGKILRKTTSVLTVLGTHGEKPGFLVPKEFSAAKNRRLSRRVKERLVFLMDMHGRNEENNFKKANQTGKQ
jgi:hypothetical protein